MTDVLFVIPARGGSARLPGKNLAAIAGIPLVGWAARTARLAARRIPGEHRVVCSTDARDIAEVAEAWGAEVPFLRAPELADDRATSAAVVIDVLDRTGLQPRIVVLVQPTSPLIEPDDLVAAVTRFDEVRGPVIGTTASHPAGWHVAPTDDGPWQRTLVGRVPVADRVVCGAIYAIAPDVLRATGTFSPDPGWTAIELPPERAIDVDRPSDLALARALRAARRPAPIHVGRRAVGPDAPCYVIAEIGVNHDGDPATAHRLVDAAADAGADAVKVQTFDPALLASDAAGLAAYQEAGVPRARSQREMLAGLALSGDDHASLQRHATERGIAFLSSPFDGPSVELLDRLDVPAFKIPSGELTNLPFLADIARRGRPMLVSTGMADLREVAAALDTIDAHGPDVGLLHCVSDYPADAADANLAAIDTMRAAFDRPVGWSDHMTDLTVALAAVARGASIVEKHLTLDRSAPGPDHRASTEPEAFRELVAAIRTIESSVGDGVKAPTAGERVMAGVARKSLHWARALPAGSTVAATDLAAMRPGDGISPASLADLVGKRTARPVEAGHQAEPADVEAAG